jgi:hypothetical protein
VTGDEFTGTIVHEGRVRLVKRERFFRFAAIDGAHELNIPPRWARWGSPAQPKTPACTDHASTPFIPPQPF